MVGTDHHMPQKPKRAHIGLFIFPFASHQIAHLSLAIKIATSAPDVLISFFTTATSNNFLGTVTAALGDIHNLKFYDVHDGIPENLVKPPEEEERGGYFVKALPMNLKTGMTVALAESGSFTCIVSDCFVWCVGEMAEEMGVPWVTFYTGGTQSLPAHYYSEQIRSTIGVGPDVISNRADQLLDFIPSLSAQRVRDLPDGIVFTNLDDPVWCMINKISKRTPLAVPLVINTYEGLDPAILTDFRSKFKTVLPIGPLNLSAPLPASPDTYGCLSWLDQFQHNSVVYACFGTVVELSPSDVIALAHGLEESGAPFLWSFKDHDQLPDGFLQRTKGRGLVVPWVPQIKVLGHSAVGAHIMHCGYNSMLDSIVGGVPMICRPFATDQKLNGRMITRVWQIGVGVESVVEKDGVKVVLHVWGFGSVGEGVLSKEGLLKALDLVLNKEEGREMRERVVALKELATRDNGPQGSSTQNFDALLKLVAKF